MDACVCPKPASLTTVERVTCNQNLGQIQRNIFQRTGFEFDANAAPTPNPITVLASWTPLWTAVDDTKIVSTPMLENFVITEAEKITEGGGDNTTIDGAELIVGAGPITVSASMAGVPPRIIQQMQALSCEVDLGVYMLNQFGKIICREMDPVGNPGDVFSVIPIVPNSIYAPYAANNGYATRDKATFSFSLAADWADDLAVVTPAFNVKTQLVQPII